MKAYLTHITDVYTITIIFLKSAQLQQGQQF